MLAKLCHLFPHSHLMWLPQFVTQAFPPKPTWNAADIPDLSGKVFVVTGGNSGIGKETCKALLSKNAKVYLAARPGSKTDEAIRELERETGKSAHFLPLDLGDLSVVKKSAEAFNSRESSLHGLILNAGVMMPPGNQLTAQGYDMQFGVNVIGHYFFLKLLYPTLVAATSPSNPSRIVWVSSSAHYRLSGTIKYDALKDASRGSLNPIGRFQRYAQSKLAEVMLSNQMAKECEKDGVVSIALDPGNIESDLYRYTPSVMNAILRATVLYPTPYGAISQLYAATAPESASFNGKYLFPWARLTEPDSRTKDPKQQENLREYLDNEIKGFL